MSVLMLKGSVSHFKVLHEATNNYSYKCTGTMHCLCTIAKSLLKAGLNSYSSIYALDNLFHGHLALSTLARPFKLCGNAA